VTDVSLSVFLQSVEKKNIFIDVFFNICADYEIDPLAWVVNDDHYHLVVCAYDNFNLGGFIKRLHSVTATLLNRFDNVTGRPVWYQYWDRQLRNERDSWKHINYVHFNPINHGYVSDIQNLNDYRFCSFSLWYEVFGTEAIEEVFESYPINDFDPFNR